MTQREAEVILKVNSKEAQEKLERLENQAADLRDRFAEAFRKGDTRGIDAINKQLQKVNKEIDNMRTNAANIRAAMVRLNEASPRELQRTIKLINNELNSGRVKRGTKEWDEYVGKLKEVQTELQKVKKEMAPDRDESFFDRLKNGINDWGATAAAATAAFAGVVMSGKAAVQAYADMEAEEANVRKYTGMTAEQVAALNDEFRKMDTRTSREDLNKLAQEAGRLGKTSVQDVLGFVKAADQINVALDDLGEGATLTLSKLTGIFGDEARYGTEQSLLKVGSVINELSQNCSASAPYLAEFSSRLGGIAAQSKMTVSQVMSFAAVLDTQNLAVEASSTAVGQLITSIYQKPAEIAKAAGMDVKKFSDMVKTDMNGALIMLFEHLNKFGGMETLATVFDRMGTDGARAIPVLAALAGHVDELKWQQQEANNAFREGTSVTNEFNVQNNTVQAQLDKAKKGFTEMAVTLGKQLLPVMRYCISGTSMLMKVISEIVNFIVKYHKELLVLVGVIASYYAGVLLSKTATMAHAVAVAYNTAVTKAAKAVQTAYNAVVGMGRVVVLAFTEGLGAARKAFVALNATMKSNALGLVLSMIAAVTAAFIAGARKVTDFSRKLEEARNTANKIREEALIQMGEEKSKIDLLVSAAQNELLSLEERQKAINQLNEIIPGYNAHLDATTGKYIAAKEKLDDYLESLTHQYELEGAREKLKEIGKEKAEATIRVNEAQKNYDKNKKEMENVNLVGGQYTTSWGSVGNSYSQAMGYLKDNLDEAKRNLEIVRTKENSVLAAYGLNLQKDAANNPPKKEPILDTSGSLSLGETDTERKERERKEREARRAAKEALKNALDERKAQYLQAEAENLTMYVTGERNYADYLAQKEQLEKDYVDDVIEIHENHNKLDIAAYGQALSSKANLLKKQQDAERKRRLEEVETEHKENSDALTSAFFDPKSPDFQNKKLLNQMLFQEDVRYLTAKRELYIKDSEEWANLDRQINERIAQDQLDKKKETAEALLAFETQYRQASGSRREQAELDMLEELHRQQLISEEEYQRAVRDIKQKYRDEDLEKARQAQSEYGDMAINLYNSITKFLEELGKEGGDFWGNLGAAASAAFALMSAGIAQYSAYANAERDLELAKTEKRYDKEIAAAGKNSKRKEKLEKQKEEAVAKIKNKYNDKAMKLELAQAVAQTAVAAINAYASAAKIAFWLGPVAAAMATAAGMVQIATIKKQHEAQAAGYYEGGFTARDSNNRREVGVVHANEFVANHQAVANPALAPVLRLIDTAQRNNTIGSLTAADVSNAIGQGVGVSARGDVSRGASYDSALIGGLSAMTQTNIAANEAITRLSDALEDGIEAKVILDGEDGFHKKYTHFQKLRNNPKR